MCRSNFCSWHCKIYKVKSHSLDANFCFFFTLTWTLIHKNYIISYHHIVQIKIYKKIKSTDLKYVCTKIHFNKLKNIIREKSWKCSHSKENIVTEISVSSSDVLSLIHVVNEKNKLKMVS